MLPKATGSGGPSGQTRRLIRGFPRHFAPDIEPPVCLHDCIQPSPPLFTLYFREKKRKWESYLWIFADIRILQYAGNVWTMWMGWTPLLNPLGTPRHGNTVLEQHSVTVGPLTRANISLQLKWPKPDVSHLECFLTEIFNRNILALQIHPNKIFGFETVY